MTDFSLFYRSKMAVESEWSARWDLFISAFNSAERVRRVYDKVTADRKLWLVHREYSYGKAELPDEPHLRLESDDEADDINAILSELTQNDFRRSLCVDCTGMMRPHLMLLPLLLSNRGVRRFDVLYSEPVQYIRKEATQFSLGGVREVRPVRGFEGLHSAQVENDLLVIGSGYDYQLIAHAAEHKRSARKIQLFGFPSLRPDMYQENVLQAYRVQESLGGQREAPQRDYFASASDAFAVAETLKEIVDREEKRAPLTNLYLSPLATKPQALGFALYWIHEWRERAASIIFPFSQSYNRETSTGCSRVWQFTVELPAM